MHRGRLTRRNCGPRPTEDSEAARFWTEGGDMDLSAFAPRRSGRNHWV